MTAQAVGFDIGGTHARACAVWWDGDWRHGDVAKIRWRTDEGGIADPDELVAAIARLAEQVGADLPGSDAPALGIGIAAQLDRSGEIVLNAPNLGWRDLALAERVEKRLGVRPAVVNDVNAILLGELHFGAARGAQDVLAVYWGTGIGGALAVDGRLVVGAGGNAGEIGHVKVVGRDEVCGCGERGCVEAFAGGAAILRRIAADPAVAGIEGGIVGLDAASRGGDEAGAALLGELVQAVGCVVAGACTLLNPQVLLLGGGVLDRAPAVWDRLANEVSARTLAVSRADMSVRHGTLGDIAGPLGAGARAASETLHGSVSIR